MSGIFGGSSNRRQGPDLSLGQKNKVNSPRPLARKRAGTARRRLSSTPWRNSPLKQIRALVSAGSIQTLTAGASILLAPERPTLNHLPPLAVNSFFQKLLKSYSQVPSITRSRR